MGRSRIQDVSCAICIDSLFTKRDDLDDLIPIATCDCGHVFHEPCLLAWFHTQSAQYVAAMRAQDIDGRLGSPSLSDAPAECPSCRAECFADPETGAPGIHRLYIDWGGALDGDTHPGSSPPPSAMGASRSKGKDKEALGLARRAKGVTEEVKGLGAQSQDEDVEGTLRRAEGLVADMVSVKALDAVKTYTAGLTRALNDVRTTLETHPLIPRLRTRNAELETAMQNMALQMHAAIAREVKQAVQNEQAKYERRVQKAYEERDVIQREYQVEKVGAKKLRQGMEERERECNRRLFELEDSLRKEREDREATQKTLRDRTKQLRNLQLKLEIRRDMKSQLDALQAENDRLKDTIRDTPSLLSDTPSLIRRKLLQSDDAESSDSRKPDMNKWTSYPDSGSWGGGPYDADESLQVVMPSFADSSPQAGSRLLPPRTTSKDLDYYGTRTSPTKKNGKAQRMHPTARTIEFDLGDKSRKRKTSSKYFSLDDDQMGEQNADVLKSEGGENERDVAQEDKDAKPSELELSSNDESGRKRGAAKRMEQAKRIEMVRPRQMTQPMEMERESVLGVGLGVGGEDRFSPAKRTKTNPFHTTKQASEKRKELPPIFPDIQDTHPSVSAAGRGGKVPADVVRERQDLDSMGEVIDLSSSSPPPIGQRQAASTALSNRPGLAKRALEGKNAGGRSVVDWLGMRDANGRPSKGVVGGAKVKRRI